MKTTASHEQCCGNCNASTPPDQDGLVFCRADPPNLFLMLQFPDDPEAVVPEVALVRMLEQFQSINLVGIKAHPVKPHVIYHSQFPCMHLYSLAFLS